jgi:hypothetical protein
MSHYLAVWHDYAPSHVQISLPTAVIDAMVAAGFLQTTDRSDGYKLADAVRSIIAAHLEPEIAQARAESASCKAAADSSFGLNSARTES